jgi:CBS domain-containing protein
MTMGYTAGDVMSRDVICVAGDMDLRDLTRLFLEAGITGAPVLDDKGDLAGVISQHDLLYYSLTRGDELVDESHFYESARVEGHRLPPGFQVEDVNSGTVADVMTPVVHAVREGATVESVARLMTRKRIHRVIVRRGRKVAGIISAVDLLKLLVRTAAKPKKAKRKA